MAALLAVDCVVAGRGPRNMAALLAVDCVVARRGPRNMADS